MQAIENFWMTLRGMNIYLEVTVAAFAAYFWVRHMMNWSLKVSVWIPLLVCFLGQIAYTLQDLSAKNDSLGIDDGFMIIFMSFFQAGMASMFYSVAEKYGLIDKLGMMLGKKIDKIEGASNAPINNSTPGGTDSK